MSWQPQQGYGQPSGGQPYHGQPQQQQYGQPQQQHQQQQQQAAYGGQYQYGAPMPVQQQTGVRQPHQGAFSLRSRASEWIAAIMICVTAIMRVSPVRSNELWLQPNAIELALAIASLTGFGFGLEMNLLANGMETIGDPTNLTKRKEQSNWAHIVSFRRAPRAGQSQWEKASPALCLQLRGHVRCSEW